MKVPQEYSGEEVVILGLARSGVAAAKLFHEMGATVTVNDKKEREECPEAEELEALGISVVCGGHPSSLIHDQVSLVVKNPGIPYTALPVQWAIDRHIEIVTEVEVAYRMSKAPIIGITGSNGKTTTTTLVGKMLEEAELSPVVAGNIGRALSEAALDANETDRLVVELSSFQLKGTTDFRPHIACLLNVYETHLDYHGSMEDYVASKAKLFANQTQEDTAVINWDDPVCRSLVPTIKAGLMPFSMKEKLLPGVYLDEHQKIVFTDRSGATHTILPAKELGIRGSHNIENALAASAIALCAGVNISNIAGVLKLFRGVEHRLEYVGTYHNLEFYNDSKATNPAATIKSIEAFEQPLVLIAGGLDRGSDYRELIPVLQERVKALVTLGQTGEKIQRAAEQAGLTRRKSVDTAKGVQEAIAEAVELAALLAEPGDTVLLSPACASWDMFSSFEERGSMFKESVHNL
ncbi:UDP-N-acetylmuramoyl-L-alanine--D-glutamate ligase [Paenibacillus larvae]|uniref:UDP-N-acetylmuramoylalanine--D-glutamate ligase n=4 Tax=Paenibacillus larvae TaxID=1464 RepID=V9W803_9BACL|nr:UDP-N-acetylmuramoyl-L-alanine--D-glutamate ligase [Paenibacillus larvae]AHD06258.1 UDP-N-acetylmuramoylalanine--D-glutamate ligase MurD [Paenibacillus larvae subsp. larvae DSM 25430]AQR77327.1 UDP-N-acetylmuramoyl-L-alanine--D-glutamate ligase [Paenibacillus larvae subsp. larvae]AQZ45302.1 UDP-N-acetylmuramoyl-L-alanine--D-glutamate ligase [Paenibacillus larvae subsp. pulvifaciens]ARF67106.1 UDP-N-acetylmuramoyl-L-alanine--D-glutamate ligase [Paenibacillus larvae subsp. pulvifaciens]AVF216